MSLACLLNFCSSSVLLNKRPNSSRIYLSRTQAFYEWLGSFTALTISVLIGRTYVKVNLFMKNLIFEPLKG
jgi:hypothetical protein